MSSQKYERNALRLDSTSKDQVAETQSPRERSFSTSLTRDQTSKRSSIFSKRPRSILTAASTDNSTRFVTLNISGSDLSRLSFGPDMPVQSIEPKPRFSFGRGIKNRMSGVKPFSTTNDSHRTVPAQGQSKPGKPFRASVLYDVQHVAQPGVQETANVRSSKVIHHFRALSKGHRHGIDAPAHDTYAGDGVDPMSVQKQRKQPPKRPRRPEDPWLHEPDCTTLVRAGGPPFTAKNVRSAIYPSSSNYRGISSEHHVPFSIGRPQIFADGAGMEIVARADAHHADPFDEYGIVMPPYDSQPPGWIENSLPLLHTVLPVDTSSDHIRTPAFNLPLEQVLEEPEGTFCNAPGRKLSRRPSLRQPKSTPMIDHFRSPIDLSVDEFPWPSPKPQLERSTSQCSESSDTLGNPLGSSCFEAVSRAQARSRDVNELNKFTEPTWEHYIEHCYAETDYEFDWHETSHFDDNISEVSERWSEQYSPFSTSLYPKVEDSRSIMSTTSHAQSMVSEKSDRMMSHTSVPELDYRCSRATSTASLSIGTPRDGSLYRNSDSPPLLTDTHILTDAWGSTHLAGGDQLYDELVVCRTPVVPDSPHHLDDRRPPLLDASVDIHEHHQQTLTTSSQTSNVPVAHEGLFRSPASIDRSSNVQSLAVASKVFSIKPRESIDDGDAASASTVDLLNASLHESMAAVWSLLDAGGESNLELASESDHASTLERRQAPNNATRPLQAGQTVLASGSSQAIPTTPSPRSKPNLRLSVEQGAVNPGPYHISFPSIDLVPFTLSDAAGQQSTPTRARNESITPLVGPLALTTPESIEEPGTPESVASAPETSGRIGYSLFPSKSSSIRAFTGPHLSMAPTSAPLTSPDPYLTGLVSRAASQASSSNSSLRALSFKSRSSKSSKKANRYQERFPFSI